MKPKVLQLIPSFHQGGTERQAVQLTRLMLQRGRYDVHISALDGDGLLRAEVECLDVGEITSYPLTSFYDRNAVIQLRRLVSYLRRMQINIIHTHDFYTNIFGLTAAKLAAVPIRVGSRRESSVRSRLQRRIERYAYRFAQVVIANCEDVRRQLIGEGVRADKVVTIHNGLDMKRLALPVSFDPDNARASFHLPNDQQLVTIVANMRLELKDHRTFLRAARRVAEAVPDVGFALAGEGELMDSLREYASQLGLQGRAFFLGRCERVAELLAISDVCVLSSRAEGFSNSILEYMAAGKPVVATDVGGAREAIVEGETGYLVRPGDDAAMAERIIELLRDTEKAKRMGERGRARVRDKFSAESQLQCVEDLYEKLLARHKGSFINSLQDLSHESSFR